MQLTREAFDRARGFLYERARPLERAVFQLEFERGTPAAVQDALAPFRNDDGGFGHALEPDLTLPDSSVLATCHALHVLREAGTPTPHPFVCTAVDWLVSAHDPALCAWRSVPEQAEAHPHAAHWAWELHRDGTRWPVGVLPHAEVLAHLYRSADRVDAALLARQTRRLVTDLESTDVTLGPDALLGCDLFARTPEAPAAARDAVAARMRKLGVAMVSRDPEQWQSYVPKPLKLAPSPAHLLSVDLAAEIERNLDYEIAHQQADGSWAPSWSWSEYPDAWAIAERAWRGHLTLANLRSLRAYGRMESVLA